MDSALAITFLFFSVTGLTLTMLDIFVAPRKMCYTDDDLEPPEGNEKLEQEGTKCLFGDEDDCHALRCRGTSNYGNNSPIRMRECYNSADVSEFDEDEEQSPLV